MELVKHFENLYIPKNFSKYHRYYNDEEGKKPYTGITTILGTIAKPALIQWAANQAVDYLQGLEQITEEDFKEARKAHRKTKEKAGERGTNIHEICEEWIKECIEKGKTEDTYEGDEKEVKQFIKWTIDNNVIFHESEKPLFDEELWIAGTADIVIEIDGKKYLADIKTSKGVYEEAFLQCAAYRYMSEKMGLKDFHGSMVIHLPKGGELKTYERYDYQADLKAFIAAHTIYKYKNNI